MVGSAMQIPIDRKSPVPLARQIQAQLERLIREGVLAPGLKLPASRDLARTLGVNRATVVLAYEEVVAAGWARWHVGQGTFVLESVRPRVAVAAAPAVAPRNGDGHGPTRAPLNWSAFFSRSARIVESEAERRRALTPPMPAESGLISFAGGMPDSGLFPTDAFRRVLNDVVRDEGETLLQYYPVAGYPPLRRYLATYLLRFGLEARPDDILIVNGSQQGFDLIARTLLDPGDAVAIEEPTYPRALQVFRSFGAQPLAVPWDAAGPRVDVFERLLDRHAPKLFYCQPSAHNPTGLSLAPETARRLLQAAGRHQVPIVEDGFDGSLYYGARPAVPLKAMDRDGVVIYIGTFSKVLFPGLHAEALLPAAIERGVAFTPGATFFVDGGGARTLRLSFSSVAAGRIDEGVRRLAETIKVAGGSTRERADRAAVPVV